MLSILFAALQMAEISVGTQAGPVCIAPDATLVLRTDGLSATRGKAASYRVWAMSHEMPAEVCRRRGREFYRDMVFRRNGLDLFKSTSGPLPELLTVETADLDPGDYRAYLVCGDIRLPFEFCIASPRPEGRVAWENSGTIKWQMVDDAEGLRLLAESATADPVAMFVDVSAEGRVVRRVVFLPDGTHRDALAEDDNTNRDRFTIDESWRSRAVVKTSPMAGCGWSLDALVPFGALVGGERVKDAWGICISSDERVTHPAEYRKRHIACYDRRKNELEFVATKVRARKASAGLLLEVSTTLRNASEDFRLVDVRMTLESLDGQVLAFSEDAASVWPGKARAIASELGEGCVRDGEKVRVRVEAFSKFGILVCSSVKDVTISYEPISIVVTEPAYRDCVFESMDLRRIVGVAVLEAGIGCPLTVTLDGPDTHEAINIAAAEVSNRFEFAFADRPKGEYFIRVGRAARRVRNLPYRSGEIWVDGAGVIHRGREKFFPFGWYSEQYRRMYPGLTVAQTYNTTLKSRAELVRTVQRAERYGCGLIASPFQSFAPIPRNLLFGASAAQGSFSAGPYAKDREQTVRMFAETAGEQLGFFAYYLADEPDGRDLNVEFFREAKELLAEIDPYHPTMLVCCQTAGAVRFSEATDIMVTDRYPVYTIGGPPLKERSCSYEAARVAAENGRTSIFTPQAFDWDYVVPGRVTRGPTYDELREQCLLALIADVKGIMLYSRYTMNPPTYHLVMGPEMLAREFMEAKDVFLARSEAVEVHASSADAKNIFAALKRDGGDVALIAVNCNPRPLEVSFRSPNIPASLHLGGSDVEMPVHSGVFTATLSAFGSAVWYAQPKAFSPDSARTEIELAEAGRRKPGNLAVASRFLTWGEMRRLAKGELNNGYPSVSVSSIGPKMIKELPAGYFLQDGMADEFPYLPYHAWAPASTDAAPAVTIDFGERKIVNRVVISRVRTEDGRWPLRSVSLEADGVSVGQVVFPSGRPRAECVFPQTAMRRLKVCVTDYDRAFLDGWISEIEAY